MRLTLASLVLLAAASPALADCKADLAAIAERSLEAGAYRMESVTTLNDGTTATTEGELVLGTGIYVRNVMQGGISEMVVLGEEGWVSMGDGWTALPKQTVMQISKSMAANLSFDAETLADVECRPGGGDGILVFGMNNSGVIAEYEIKIDNATGLPHTMSIVTPDGNMVTTFDYDPSITIKRPQI